MALDEQQWPAGLYVVGTPIGNLADLSARAAETLRRARLVAAEDTRTARRLLDHVGSRAPTVSLTEHNVEARVPALLSEARQGIAALVSEAGTPLVSDPGARLVAAAHDAGVRVVPVPGPSALTAALSVSGFEASDVRFLGFLPKQPGRLAAHLREAATGARVLVFFERANRLPRSLTAVAEAFGDPLVVVCREMTKLHEEVARGPASALAGRFARAKGECTVVVSLPARARAAADDSARAVLAAMRRAGARRSAAAAEVARLFGVSRQRAYEWWEETEDEQPAPTGELC